MLYERLTQWAAAVGISLIVPAVMLVMLVMLMMAGCAGQQAAFQGTLPHCDVHYSDANGWTVYNDGIHPPCAIQISR